MSELIYERVWTEEYDNFTAYLQIYKWNENDFRIELEQENPEPYVNVNRKELRDIYLVLKKEFENEPSL